MLESTTFADLAERLRVPAEEMWHILTTLYLPLAPQRLLRLCI